MGKATRWLKGLLGMKKDKENVDNLSKCSDKKENKRWSFGRSEKQSGSTGEVGLNNFRVTDSDWLRSLVSETEKEQNKHAIAVAAATAAAADAAVAAAQAAVAVVRLTNQGRRAVFFNGKREKNAAVKIQSVFKGYLSRKALRALKGLVKLQALVRGYLVRKRAAATLHSMQALFRAQAAVCSQRARRSNIINYKYPSYLQARRSMEKMDDCRSEYNNSKRLSGSYDASLVGSDETASPKIVEIDTCKSKSRSRGRIHTCMSDSGDDHHHYLPMSSPFPCPIRPGHLSIPDYRHLQEIIDWNFIGDEYKKNKFASAQNTPRFLNSRLSVNNPVTPSSKSVAGDSFFRPYSNYYPSYMANTQSFKAKSRSYSAPKQRPEATLLPRTKISLNEMMASRTSFNGVRMQRP